MVSASIELDRTGCEHSFAGSFQLIDGWEIGDCGKCHRPIGRRLTCEGEPIDLVQLVRLEDGSAVFRNKREHLEDLYRELFDLDEQARGLFNQVKASQWRQRDELMTRLLPIENRRSEAIRSIHALSEH